MFTVRFGVGLRSRVWNLGLKKMTFSRCRLTVGKRPIVVLAVVEFQAVLDIWRYYVC